MHIGRCIIIIIIIIIIRVGFDAAFCFCCCGGERELRRRRSVDVWERTDGKRTRDVNSAFTLRLMLREHIRPQCVYQMSELRDSGCFDDDDDYFSEEGGKGSLSSHSDDDEEDEEEEEEKDFISWHQSDESLDDHPMMPICRGSCRCSVLRDWIEKQSARKTGLIEGDEFYRTNKTKIWGINNGGGTLIKNRAQCSLDPYPTISSESFRYSGERDKFGRPHGRGSLYFPTGRKFMGKFRRGLRQGFGELYDKEGARILGGEYEGDRLHGIGEIVGSDGSVLEVNFYRGVAHGPARRYSNEGTLLWLGRYRQGIPYGLCWKSHDNEGWLVGSVNRYGRLHGSDIVYIYPDFHTMLIGSWDSDNMKSGKLGFLSGIVYKEGFPIPKVKKQKPERAYTTDTSSYSKIATRPLLRDPYEELYVVCRKSQVCGAEDGLFVTRDVPTGKVVAFYNGVRFHDCHVTTLKAFNDWDFNSYKIRLNEKKKLILDIPPEYRDIENYSATLAHKVNHSFSPNAHFTDFVHPRFGRILCVKTLKPLKKGQEIFCNYGYNLNDCPDWYKDLHDSLFFDQRASIIPTLPEELKLELKKTSNFYSGL